MNILSDLNIPGYEVLKWLMIVLIFAPLAIVTLSSDSDVLSLILKILVLLFDSICVYIAFFIFKRKAFQRYFNVVLALAVMAIGETLIAF